MREAIQDPRAAGAAELVNLRIPVKGVIGADCTQVEESVVRLPIVNGVSYTQFTLKAVSEVEALPQNAHPVRAPLPRASLITSLDDEEVLRKFPRGAMELTFREPVSLWAVNGRNAGLQETCHPLTSCSAPQPFDACAALFRRDGDLDIYGAVVTGPGGYALRTNRGEIAMSNGVGSVSGANVRVNETTIQFEFATRTPNNEGNETHVSATCTYPFRWP
ncbi:MAG: hypothetical protein U0174_25020 [Polyangiaceae bacterium]